MAFLSLEGISKHFGDFVAVEGLSLSIEKGEFVSLLGPSGCGKTTTLQMIAGLHAPTAGRIFLDGEDITDKAPNRRGLGIVFQSYALFPHMTVTENVSFGLEMRGVASAARSAKVADALEQVRLAEFSQRYPRELSGGQRQRVALARALVIEPPVLLLDEPLSNLDAKLREDMQIELRMLQQSIGVTTILVTHDQSEALSMSDRVVVMNNGKVVQIDTPVGMYDAPIDAFVSAFVGKSNLFEGTVSKVGDGTVTIDVNGVPVTANATGIAAGSSVFVSLRPEKLSLCGANETIGVAGEIEASIFHGDQWLYKVSSALGDVILTEPNVGGEPHKRKDKIRLTWAENAVRVLVPGNQA
jgi:putative spermidine/putrescine transport system ATP-binding protein